MLLDAAFPALLAARLRQTLVTASFFALVTGVGGGTIRDLLLDAPVFWLRDPWISPVILATALLAWFTPRRWWEGNLLEMLDAAGLAAFSVLGTAKAINYGVAPIPAVVLGIVTGCAGGIIRDVVAGVLVRLGDELATAAGALGQREHAVVDELHQPPRAGDGQQRLDGAGAHLLAVEAKGLDDRVDLLQRAGLGEVLVDV